MAATGICPEEGTLTSQNLIDFFVWFFINALDPKQHSCRAVHGVVRVRDELSTFLPRILSLIVQIVVNLSNLRHSSKFTAVRINIDYWVNN